MNEETRKAIAFLVKELVGREVATIKAEFASVVAEKDVEIRELKASFIELAADFKLDLQAKLYERLDAFRDLQSECAQVMDALKDGEDASPEDVAMLLKADVDFLDSVTGAKGDKGDTPEIDMHELSKAVSEDDSFWESMTQIIPAPVPGEKGDPGKDALFDPLATAQALRQDTDFMQTVNASFPPPAPGKQGKPGKDADPAEVAELLRADTGFLNTVQGRDGDPGKDGKDGVDRPIFEVLEQIDDAVPKNTFLAHNGGVYQSTRRTTKTPDESPSAWTLILSGVNDVRVQEVDERNVEIVVDYTHGKTSKNLYLPLPIHRGTHEIGREYALADEVIKNDCTYRALQPTKTTPPHADWQTVAKSKQGRRGKDGTDATGKPGPQGDPGIGIKDAAFDGNTLVLIRDDETAITVDVEPSGELENSNEGEQ